MSLFFYPGDLNKLGHKRLTGQLFNCHFSFPDVTDEMLAFFLTLFQALRVQMGVAFTGQIIHTFLSMFTR